LKRGDKQALLRRSEEKTMSHRGRAWLFPPWEEGRGKKREMTNSVTEPRKKIGKGQGFISLVVKRGGRKKK